MFYKGNRYKSWSFWPCLTDKIHIECLQHLQKRPRPLTFVFKIMSNLILVSRYVMTKDALWPHHMKQYQQLNLISYIIYTINCLSLLFRNCSMFAFIVNMYSYSVRFQYSFLFLRFCNMQLLIMFLNCFVI